LLVFWKRKHYDLSFFQLEHNVLAGWHALTHLIDFPRRDNLFAALWNEKVTADQSDFGNLAIDHLTLKDVTADCELNSVFLSEDLE